MKKIKSCFKRHFLGIEEVYIEIYNKHAKFPSENIYIEHKIRDSIFDIDEFKEIYSKYLNGKLIHIQTICHCKNKIFMKFMKSK